MQFRVLGPLEVVRDGANLALGPDKQRALLALLVLRSNTVVRAEQLVDEVWQGRPPPQAPSSLYAYVSRLRRLLGAERVGIVSRKPGYELRVHPESIDARRFERLVRAAQVSRGSGDVAAAAAVLDEALDEWRAEPVADVPWLSTLPELVHLAEQRTDAVEQWADAMLALGRHAEVAARLDGEVARAPFREALRGSLMVALYRSGRQADALRAYREGHDVLVEQLGLVPAPELQRLEVDILHHSPALDLRPLGEQPVRRPSASTGFVGRERELEVLREARRTASDGRTTIALIDGEPGVGKTRLAEEVGVLAGRAGARLLWGRCLDGGAGVPFLPWARALRDLQIAELAQATGTGRTPLSEADRIMLFHAIADRLAEAAAQRPVVLVLDDLQWADTASLRLLEVVADELAQAQLLLIVTVRRAEVPEDQPVARTLASLARAGHTVQLRLEGFTEEEVGCLLAGLGCAGTARMAAALRDLTDGNPFFLHEIAGLLAARGRLQGCDEGDLTDLGIPGGVGDVIRARLGALPASSVELLREVSVAGRHFDLDVLTALRGPSAADHLTVLDHARRAGLVAEVAGHLGCFRFTHELVRQALRDDLSSAARVLLHQRLAEGLDRLHGTDPARAAELAHHYLVVARSGAVPGCAGRALHHSVRAGERALSDLGYEQAVVHFSDALEILGPAPPVVRARLLLALGGAHWRAGDVPAAQAAFIEAADLATAADDVELLGEAVVGIGGGPYRTWHAARGDLSELVIDHLEGALAGIAEEDSAVRARLLGCLAESLYYRDPRRRWSLSAEALTMAERVGDPVTLASALCSRLLSVWDAEGLTERLALTPRISELAEVLGDEQLALFGCRHRAVALLEHGDVAAAVQVLEDFERRAEVLKQPIYLWEATWLGAMVVLLRGQLVEAEELATAALHRGQGTRDDDAFSIYGSQLAVIRIEQGRLGELEGALRDIAGDFPDIWAWQVALAGALADLGKHSEAQARLDGLAADGFADLPDDFVRLGALVLLARLCVVLDDRGRAEQVYGLLAPFAGRNVLVADRLCWGSAARYLGMLAATLGRREVALAHLEEAVSANDRMGARGWAAHARADLADLLERRGAAGDGDRAAALRLAARGAAEELGMAALLRALQR